MEKKGYKTYMSGKWHVSIDAKKVFQTVRNIKPGMPEDFRKKDDLGNWIGKGNRPINERR